MARFVQVARERFALPPGTEITVEANPRDLDAEGYRRLLDLGANRLSLGVQSLDDGVLKEMGRSHSAADARRAVEDARRAGFSSLNLDLILGWPGETRERWRLGLELFLALAPDHVSLYVLEVEEKTVLAHRQQHGRLTLPDDDLVADLYQETVDRLAARGLDRYEISNFARPGFESRHNGKYRDDAPFLGFGMSAHSCRHGRRWWNNDRFATYCRAVEEGGGAAAAAGERRLTARERRAEALFTGLRRRDGVDLAVFRKRYGLDPLACSGCSCRVGRRRSRQDRPQVRPESVPSRRPARTAAVPVNFTPATCVPSAARRRHRTSAPRERSIDPSTP